MKIKLVTVSPNDKFDSVDSILKHNIVNDIDIIKYENNILGLSTVYNNELNKDNSDYDYVIFCHNDIYFKDINEAIKTLQLNIEKDKYDIIGVAGSTSINMNTCPLGWYPSTKPINRRGKVWHGDYLNNPIVDDFGNRDCRVMSIDGLIIIFGKNAIKSNIRFDETFMFDFYDMDISFTAHILHKLRIGVLPIDLIHKSNGPGILSDKYKEIEKIFKTKWLNILR